MKNINDYFNEALISKDTKIDTDYNIIDNKNPSQTINYLKDLCKDKGLTIRFRDKANDAGDFTIFIYDKSVKPGYLVGYDGYWDPKYSDLTFKKCAQLALKYINNYKK